MKKVEATTGKANHTPDASAGQTPTPKEKKISANEFVMNLICEQPESTAEDIQKALEAADLKLNEYSIATWIRDMKKVFARLDELGWKKPKGK